MSLPEYEQKLEEQDNKCIICGQEETTVIHGKVSLLAMDHDHSCCNKRNASRKTSDSCQWCNRMFLCRRCNLLLGAANDSIEILEEAAKYLRAWQVTREWMDIQEIEDLKECELGVTYAS
jgi:hypothetical protein